jgi:hypothetical protein
MNKGTQRLIGTRFEPAVKRRRYFEVRSDVPAPERGLKAFRPHWTALRPAGTAGTERSSL